MLIARLRLRLPAPQNNALRVLHLLKHLFHVGEAKLALVVVLLQRVQPAGGDLVCLGQSSSTRPATPRTARRLWSYRANLPNYARPLHSPISPPFGQSIAQPASVYGIGVVRAMPDGCAEMGWATR
jgi:hypothetical protein